MLKILPILTSPHASTRGSECITQKTDSRAQKIERKAGSNHLTPHGGFDTYIRAFEVEILGASIELAPPLIYSQLTLALDASSIIFSKVGLVGIWSIDGPIVADIKVWGNEVDGA